MIEELFKTKLYPLKKSFQSYITCSIWRSFDFIFWGLMITNQVANLMCIPLLVKTISSQLQMENGNPHLILHLQNLSTNNLDLVYYCTFVPNIQYIIGPQLSKWEKPCGSVGTHFLTLVKVCFNPKTLFWPTSPLIP